MKNKLLYEKLVNEFKKKLARELTSKEDCFLHWVSEQQENKSKSK